MKDGFYREYFKIASSVLEKAEDAGERIVTNLLAPRMVQQLDPEQITPEIMEYGTLQFCIQMLGKVCREQYGTVKNPAGDAITTQLSFKEFGNRLQNRYPVEVENGLTEYKHIDELTQEESEAICVKLEKIGAAYIESADQLRRYKRATFRRDGHA